MTPLFSANGTTLLMVTALLESFATIDAELKAAIADAFDQSGPSVIEVPMGLMPDPWEWYLGTRIRPAGTA